MSVAAAGDATDNARDMAVLGGAHFAAALLPTIAPVGLLAAVLAVRRWLLATTKQAAPQPDDSFTVLASLLCVQAGIVLYSLLAFEKDSGETPYFFALGSAMVVLTVGLSLTWQRLRRGRGLS